MQAVAIRLVLLTTMETFSCARHFAKVCKLLPAIRQMSSSLRHLPNRLPAAYYRGGTSRAVIFKSNDLPADRSTWNSIFLGVLGSPDAQNGRQLDGLGGGISSLSKICVVGKSQRSDADVDYTFAAIGVRDSEVDFSSNCGNMSSAIGPFAVDSGLVDVTSAGDEKLVTVRIHNTNTGKTINSTFPVIDGEASTYGDFEIDGVTGKAAPVQLDFVNPAGSKTGKLLPTGSVIDEFDGVPTTCVDVGNPCCFVQASSFDVAGNLTPDQIDSHPTLMRSLDSVRRQAGVKMGLADTVSKVPGSIPKICMVSPTGSTGERKTDVTVRALSVGQPHKAVPITVALSTAAAAKLPGSVVNCCTSDVPIDPIGITLGHASGTLAVQAKFDDQGQLESATVFRTARRLMEGTIFWK